MTEVPSSEYALTMNLTIRGLEKEDIGGYVCSSANALGTSTGVVRVQGTYGYHQRPTQFGPWKDMIRCELF